MLEIIFSYFWLICGIWVGLFGAAYNYIALRKHVASGRLNKSEAWPLVQGWALLFLSVSVMFWLLQQSAGPAQTPFYIEWPNPEKAVAIGINVFLWGLLLWWVWLGKGASYLAKILPIISARMPEFMLSQVAIRILSLVIVASGVFALFSGGG